MRVKLALPVLLLGGLPVGADAAVFLDNWQSVLSVQTYQDSRTGDRQFAAGSERRWDIAPGADSYTDEVYERPVGSSPDTQGGKLGFKKYHEPLDLASGKFANDTTNQVAYASLDLYGMDEVDQSGSRSTTGFKHFYCVRVADNGNFFNGYMFGVKDPKGNGATNSFNSADANKTTQYWNDPGTPVSGTGRTVTNEGTAGYGQVTREGQSESIQARIVGNSVQLAIAYGELGLTAAVFANLLLEANQGLTDVANCFWNDEYSAMQAGSPYSLTNPPGNIYELDTLLTPIPAAAWLFGSALVGLGVVARRRNARAQATGA